MNNFLYLLLAHLLLDYPAQGEFLGLGKAKYNFLLLVHCVMWALGCAAVLEWLHLYSDWKLYWLFLGHISMDYLKCRGHIDKLVIACRDIEARRRGYEQAADRHVDPLRSPLYIDQAWHIVQLVVCL